MSVGPAEEKAVVKVKRRVAFSKRAYVLDKLKPHFEIYDGSRNMPKVGQAFSVEGQPYQSIMMNRRYSRKSDAVVS